MAPRAHARRLPGDVLGARRAASRPWQDSLFSSLCWAQGLYYLATGLWPLFSIETFQAVTGPKTDHLVTGRAGDHWLVMTVGVLVSSVALTLLVAAWRRTRAPEIAVLAATSALGLFAIDNIYVLREVIHPVYLLDAVIEIALVAGWALTWVARSPTESA